MIEKTKEILSDDNIKEMAEEYTGSHEEYHGFILGCNVLADKIEELVKNCSIPDVSFELPSDDIFDMQEVDLKNPLAEFYYYERPAYLEDDQKQFRERLQKAIDYLKGN